MRISIWISWAYTSVQNLILFWILQIFSKVTLQDILLHKGQRTGRYRVTGTVRFSACRILLLSLQKITKLCFSSIFQGLGRSVGVVLNQCVSRSGIFESIWIRKRILIRASEFVTIETGVISSLVLYVSPHCNFFSWP
jgi:hypothetical protein